MRFPRRRRSGIERDYAGTIWIAPEHLGLLEDIDHDYYFNAPAAVTQWRVDGEAE